MMTRRLCVLLATLSTLGACDNSPVAPSGATDLTPSSSSSHASPRFVLRDAGAPHFQNGPATAVVRPGEPAVITLRFENGDPFVTLALPAEALLGATVNGVPVDSDQPLTVSIEAVNAVQFRVRMLPAGLEFNPAAPGVVTFSRTYARAHGPSSVWKQHTPRDEWETVETVLDPLGGAVAPVEDFTTFALATS